MASRSLKALCSYLPSPSLTKALHTTQLAVGGPVWQEALVQHCLEELQGSLRLFFYSAGTNQSIVGDPVWQEAVVQHCLEELQSSLRLCTYTQALTKSL